MKQLGMASLIIVVPLLTAFLLKGAFSQAVSLSEVITATVERGEVQMTIQGSGTVAPVYEEVITSPFRSSVIKIMKKPGAGIVIGDTLVLLNTTIAEEELDMARNELKVQEIRLKKARVELTQMSEDFEYNSRIKEIQIDNLKFDYEAESELNKMGGSPAWNVKRAKTQYDIAQLELNQAKSNFKNQVNSRKIGIDELETEISIRKHRIAKSENQLSMACVRAALNGNLSWIVSQPGVTISEGQEIARIADFSQYKLAGKISNSWAGRIFTGQKVLVRDQERSLTGSIENIMPAINQGMIECSIRINEGNISNLRPEQQMEIRVIISNKNDVLRLPNGTYYEERGYKEMYVIRGNKAFRTRVLLGDANFDYVEVVEGLREGEKVILDDIGQRYTQNEIKVFK